MSKQQAADLLWNTWQAGAVIPALPDGIQPRTRAEGYAIQATLEQRTTAPIFGWKIAATSKAGQAHIGVEGPLAGRLLAERAHRSGDVLQFGANRMRVAEPEFAFRIGRDLAPRATAYRMDEVMAAVASLHPAIEIPDSRFEDFVAAGAAQLIADNACAHEFVLGPACPPLWREIDLAQHRAKATVVGRFDRDGIGANVLDDPRLALTWLANELSSIDVTLRAGQVVTTGTCAVPLPIRPGDEVRVDFGVIGTVGLRFG